jgi:hypothetical protein
MQTICITVDMMVTSYSKQRICITVCIELVWFSATCVLRQYCFCLFTFLKVIGKQMTFYGLYVRSQ